MTRNIQLLVWLYFALLIFEGALRKWVLPGLATPLLIVRDPVVLLALLFGFTSGKIRLNGIIVTLGLISVASLMLTLTVGHGDVAVAVFGWRCNFLHFPFIFLIGRILTLQDVRLIGQWFMLLSIPMVALMSVQFYSPVGSFWNIGIGGIGDSGFDGAMGYRRPPGTFSFITGPALFYPIVAAFCMNVLFDSSGRGKLLSLAATAATLASIPFSLSRTLALGVGLVVVGSLIALARSGRNIQHVLGGLSLILLTLFLLSFIPGLNKPREAFLSRWEASTTNVEGGAQEAIIGRIVGGFLNGLSVSDANNLLTGAGLGMGTNAGSKLLTGDVSFLISEGESGRIIGEMGLPLGLLYIGLKCMLAANLFAGAWALARRGEPLALMLWFTVAPNLIQGQWGQPTSLGFATFGAGLILAEINGNKVNQSVIEELDPELDDQSPDFCSYLESNHRANK